MIKVSIATVLPGWKVAINSQHEKVKIHDPDAAKFL